MRKIALSREELVYCGRTDRTDPRRPEFIFPASSLQFRFRGKMAVLSVENRRISHENYVGAIVDGEQKKWRLHHEGLTRITLLSEEEDREHEVLFFKRQDTCHEIRLTELAISDGGELLPAPPRPERRIEIYGDSVSAGELAEAVDCVGDPDPEHDGEYSNSWYSYAWMAARLLHAEISDISKGGIPLLNGTGYVSPPDYPGMEFIWDKVHWHPQLGKVTGWNFAGYRPHLVIVAIGQNDSFPRDFMREDPGGEMAERWKYSYRLLVRSIRARYPEAVILLTTTIMIHDPSWDEAIEEICRDLGDDRVRHFLYKRNGQGTPGHPRIQEAQEMAEELAAYVNGLEIPVWEK